MNHLLPQTQDLLNDLKKGQDVVIMSYDKLVSLLATMEEEMDSESRKSRLEAEEDIKKGNISSLDDLESEI